jgi:hypothetical protein
MNWEDILGGKEGMAGLKVSMAPPTSDNPNRQIRIGMGKFWFDGFPVVVSIPELRFYELNWKNQWIFACILLKLRMKYWDVFNFNVLRNGSAKKQLVIFAIIDKVWWISSKICLIRDYNLESRDWIPKKKSEIPGLKIDTTKSFWWAAAIYLCIFIHSVYFMQVARTRLQMTGRPLSGSFPSNPWRTTLDKCRQPRPSHHPTMEVGVGCLESQLEAQSWCRIRRRRARTDVQGPNNHSLGPGTSTSRLRGAAESILLAGQELDTLLLKNQTAETAQVVNSSNLTLVAESPKAMLIIKPSNVKKITVS